VCYACVMACVLCCVCYVCVLCVCVMLCVLCRVCYAVCVMRVLWRASLRHDGHPDVCGGPPGVSDPGTQTHPAPAAHQQERHEARTGGERDAAQDQEEAPPPGYRFNNIYIYSIYIERDITLLISDLF